MNDYALFLLPGILLLLTIGFGIWLARVGKPYHQILFNVHKLIALTGVVLAVVRIIDLDPITPVRGLFLGSLIGAVLAVIGLFVTGALMSIRENGTSQPKWFHKGALTLLILSLILVSCLIL